MLSVVGISGDRVGVSLDMTTLSYWNHFCCPLPLHQIGIGTDVTKTGILATGSLL